MFGCIRKLGCLFLLVVAGAGIYFYTNNRWTPRAGSGGSASRGSAWEPINALNAERGRRSIESLQSSRGQVFANLSAGEAASYIFLSAARQMPAGAQHAAASVQNDELLVRAEVPLSEFGAKKILGPLAGFVGERDTLLLGGRINVVEPGLGEFQVTRLRVGKLSVPSQLIPRLLNEIRKGDRPVGVGANALPVPMPEYVSDVRIANGRITIYKNAP